MNGVQRDLDDPQPAVRDEGRGRNSDPEGHRASVLNHTRVVAELAHL